MIAGMKRVSTFLMSAPSWVWVFLFPLGIIALIGTIVLSFYVLANVEGVASLIFLIIGWGMAKAFTSDSELSAKTPGSSLMLGGAICFYALMGMAIDQPGNYFFNKPIEWLLCPTATSLSRGIDVSHPLPGRTDITQDFRCLDQSGELIARPSLFGVIGIRFVEYVLVVYGFMAVFQLLGSLSGMYSPSKKEHA
jgi:hypothetical protein